MFKNVYLGSDDLKRMGKDVFKMFQERFIPTQRSSHHFRFGLSWILAKRFIINIAI